MKQSIKKVIKLFLKRLGIGIARYETLETLQGAISAVHDLKILQGFNSEAHAHQLLTYLGKSRSQLRQDLFVLSHLGFKKNGYFVEFGATNGFDLSNTYLMEKEFGWHGILAEPGKVWHTDLKNNRHCHIETRCVWKESNATLSFNQVAEAELSTISAYSDIDCHKEARKEGKTYSVNTISLTDLLLTYHAPPHIDYLSIDTEGSEYEILRHFDFSRHTFGVITCEHNGTTMRENLYSLLTTHGYKRVHEDLSCFDDWYINASLPPH